MCNAIVQNGPKQGKNLKTFKWKRKIVKAAQSLSIDQKHLTQLVFLTFVKNAIQVCMCYKCLCKFSFLVIRVP